MKTREVSQVIYRDGLKTDRKMVVNVCAVCGDPFKGRVEAKACSPECTTQLRSISAKNRTKHP